MQQHTDATTPRKSERIFHFITVTFLLVAIIATFIQKLRESAAAIAATEVAFGAKSTDGNRSNVQHANQDAEHWWILSLAAVSLAILSLVIAMWRREKYFLAWWCSIILLAFYVLLQLVMV